MAGGARPYFAQPALSGGTPMGAAPTSEPVQAELPAAEVTAGTEMVELSSSLVEPAELPAVPWLWSPLDAGPAVIAAADIAIVPAPRIEASAAAPALPSPSIWTMPHDALPETVEQSPYETAAGILERLASIAPVLTDALLSILGAADKGLLVRLFGLSPAESAPEDLLAEPEPDPVDPAPPAKPAWFLGNADQQVPDNGNWTWDSQGRRQQRLPSSFPRQVPNYAPTSWRTR